MAAYVVVDIDITDPDTYKEYTKLVPATLEPFGGEFIVRGGNVEVMEGAWSPKRFVVIRFESAARAREWLESETYASARAMRHRAANSNLIIVEGL